MRFPSTLTPGILLKRYKRFLADIKHEDGSTLTAHCPNTGSMRSCSTPGSRVYLSFSDSPKRKYPYTLEMVEDNNHWVGVNTALTNSLVKEALEKNQIKEFADLTVIKPEVRVGPNCRLDFQVQDANNVTTYIEVKNCSLALRNCAMFPDTVTARGTKHLSELKKFAKSNKKSCIFFLVQRMDATSFSPADHIDEVYGKTLREAIEAGVQILVYQAEVSPRGITIVGSLPFVL